MGGINSNVVLMLHGDGEDGGTVFVDSVSGRSVTAKGAAVTASALKQFGTGAIRLSGGTDAVSIQFNSALQFSAGDWTIDCWALIKQSAGQWSTAAMRLYGQYVNENNRWHVNINSNTFTAYFISAGVLSLFSTFVAPPSFGSVSFHHFATTRSGGTIRCFVDGSKVVSAPMTNTNWPILSAPFTVGDYDGTQQFWRGAVDELRITKGVAIWTENFTPPTEPYTWDLPAASVAITAPNIQPLWVTPSVNVQVANRLKLEVATKKMDFSADTLAALLMSAGFTFDVDTHHIYSDVLTDALTATSQTIAAQVSEDDTSDVVSIWFSNISWLAAASTSMAGCLLYDVTTSAIIGFIPKAVTIPAGESLVAKGVSIRLG